MTVYNESALSMTTEWTASTTPAQAYAHPIDGIAADYTPTTTSAVGYTGGAAASTATSDSDSAAPRRAGGGSGELRSMGVVAALLAVSAVAFLL